MKKLFRNKPMATRNPINPMATRGHLSGAMRSLISTAVVVVFVVVVLSLLQRGSVC